MKNPKSLLSSEEIESIESDGLGFGPDGNFVHLGDNQEVVFTLKGRAAFEYAISYFGYEGNFPSIKSSKQLMEFQLLIDELLIKSLKRDLKSFQENCSNPSEDSALVNAVLHGTPLQLRDTLSKSLDLKKAGSNIELLPQRKHSQPITS